MILKLVKVKGDSMSPLFLHGDYLLLTDFPTPTFWIRKGKFIVFHSEQYGLLVKRIAKIDKHKKVFWAEGMNPYSITTEQMGENDFSSVEGRVLWCFQQKKSRKNPMKKMKLRKQKELK